VNYHEAFVDGNRLCIVMEYAPHGDLSRAIRKRASQQKYYSEDQIWSYLIQLAHGLQAMHKARILHRDVKTANVLRCAGETVKLSDLGVAKLMKGAMTKTQIGTPHYMPPEVRASASTCTHCAHDATPQQRLQASSASPHSKSVFSPRRLAGVEEPAILLLQRHMGAGVRGVRAGDLRCAVRGSLARGASLPRAAGQVQPAAQFLLTGAAPGVNSPPCPTLAQVTTHCRRGPYPRYSRGGKEDVTPPRVS
jgi:serine/threonine protein kinase